MSVDLLALLDQLEEARAKATPGPWVQHPADLLYVIGDVSDGGESYLDVADTVAAEYPDAALIVAAVNNLPKLTAALRAVLELAEQWRYKGEFGHGPWQEGYGPDPEGYFLDQASSDLRAALTAALTPQDGAR